MESKMKCLSKIVIAMASLCSTLPATASTTTYSYDARGRLIQVADGAGRKIDYTLDSAGNRTNVADETAGVLAPKIVSFTTPTQVNQAGLYATLNWASSNAVSCRMTVNGVLVYPTLAVTGAVSVQINTMSTFVLTCINGSLSASSTKTVRIRDIN